MIRFRAIECTQTQIEVYPTMRRSCFTSSFLSLIYFFRYYPFVSARRVDARSGVELNAIIQAQVFIPNERTPRHPAPCARLRRQPRFDSREPNRSVKNCFVTRLYLSRDSVDRHSPHDEKSCFRSASVKSQRKRTSICRRKTRSCKKEYSLNKIPGCARI